MELSKNQHLVGYDISLNSIHPAAWAQEKAKSLGILDLSPSHIEKLSGDNTRQEKDRVMAALMTGYYIKQQNRTLFCKTSQQFFFMDKPDRLIISLSIGFIFVKLEQNINNFGTA